MTPPKVAVAVVTYNSAAVVGDCLASLDRAFGDGFDFDLIVVDNASSDATLEVVRREAPTARVVELGENVGYAAGINTAVDAAAPFDALLVLNPDVRLAPGSVQPLFDALDAPGVGITVPRVQDAEGRLVHSLRRDPTVRRALGEALIGGHRAGRIAWLGEVVRDPDAYAGGGDHDWASGAVMLISAPCLEAAGRWSEDFFLYSEESDFVWRCRHHGYALRYVPEAHAVHLGGESGVSPELWRLLTHNRVRAFARHHGPIRSAAYWAAVVLNEALRAAAGSRTHRAALGALLTPWRRPSVSGRPVPGSDTPVPGYVCFSGHDWWYHSHAHSDFQLMQRVARERRVLFVNSITVRMPRLGRTPMFWQKIWRKLRSLGRFLRRPVPGLPHFWVMTPVFVPAYGNRMVRALNARLVAFQISLVRRLLGIREAVCIATIPTAWDVITRQRYRRVVANRVDRYAAFGEANAAVVGDLEEALTTNADAVAYASRALMADETDLAGDRAFFLDHGVDLDRFTRRRDDEVPDDLRAIPSPRAGFFGTLRDYTVDLGLLAHLARTAPDVQVVLVGPAACPIGELERLPNVHWLGPRPYERIPAYGSGFDVALMPWLENEWMRYANPIKLKEYLALGLPVVSTDFPEVRHYREWIRVAGDACEFVDLVRQTIADRGPGTSNDRRRAVADSSWDARARQLMQAAEARPQVGAQLDPS